MQLERVRMLKSTRRMSICQGLLEPLQSAASRQGGSGATAHNNSSSNYSSRSHGAAHTASGSDNSAGNSDGVPTCEDGGGPGRQHLPLQEEAEEEGVEYAYEGMDVEGQDVGAHHVQWRARYEQQRQHHQDQQPQLLEGLHQRQEEASAPLQASGQQQQQQLRPYGRLVQPVALGAGHHVVGGVAAGVLAGQMGLTMQELAGGPATLAVGGDQAGALASHAHEADAWRHHPGAPFGPAHQVGVWVCGFSLGALLEHDARAAGERPSVRRCVWGGGAVPWMGWGGRNALSARIGTGCAPSPPTTNHPSCL